MCVLGCKNGFHLLCLQYVRSNVCVCVCARVLACVSHPLLQCLQSMVSLGSPMLTKGEEVIIYTSCCRSTHADTHLHTPGKMRRCAHSSLLAKFAPCNAFGSNPRRLVKLQGCVFGVYLCVFTCASNTNTPCRAMFSEAKLPSLISLNLSHS